MMAAAEVVFRVAAGPGAGAATLSFETAPEA